MTEAQKQQASDPAATGHQLQALSTEPELWPLIAANPAAYPDLLDYLREHGGPEVQAALTARAAAAAVPESPAAPAPPVVPPAPAASASPPPPAPGATAAYPAYAPTPPSARTPGSRKPLIITLVVVGALIIIGGALAVTVAVLNSTVYSPQARAQEFFGHVAKGEFGAATQQLLTPPTSADGIDTTLIDAPTVTLIEGLTDIAFGPQQSDPRGSGSVYFPVTATLAGERISGEIVLAPADTVALVLRNWKVQYVTFGSLIGVSSNGATDLQIGGVPIEPSEDGYVSLAAYPGVYGYTTGGDDRFFHYSADVDRIVVGETNGDVYFTATASDALLQEAATLATQRIDACIDEELTSCSYVWSAGQSTNATTCSYFPVTGYPEWYRAIDLKVDEYPLITVDAYSRADGGYAYTDMGDEGSATVTWEELDFATNAWVACSTEATVEFSADIVFDGDSIAFDEYWR